MLRKGQFAVTHRVQNHFTHGQAHVLALFHSFHGHVFEHFIWIDRLLDLVLYPPFLDHCFLTSLHVLAAVDGNISPGHECRLVGT
jgi:hypothetical protein